MSSYDETKETELKLKKNMAHMTTEARDLKENVVELARNVRDASADKAHVFTDYLRDRASEMKASGINSLEKIEGRIRSKPGQSIAIAFTAGLLASYLLGRRSS